MSAIVYGMPNSEYRAHEGLSYSESKLLQRSPMHLRYWLDHPELRTTSSPAQAFGTMVHTALLEPTTFDQRYAIGPTVNKNSAQWKDFKVMCETSGLIATTAEDREAAFTCAANVRAHPTVGPLLKEGHAEVSVFWTDPVTECPCKARLDWVHPAGRRALLLDLKTAQDASRNAFTRSVTNFQYNRQADWYEGGYRIASGLDVSPMLFVVVESLPPYAVAAYTLDKWFYAQAAKLNRSIRDLYGACVQFEEWPGYNPGITDLIAPRYALDEDLRELQREEDYAS